MSKVTSDNAERLVATLADDLTAPNGQCLVCYLVRMLTEFGCDNTLRWAGRWRDSQAPKDKGLLGRLERNGGYCDCEVLLNVFPDRLPEDDSAELPSCGDCQTDRAGGEENSDDRGSGHDR